MGVGCLREQSQYGNENVYHNERPRPRLLDAADSLPSLRLLLNLDVSVGSVE